MVRQVGIAPTVFLEYEIYRLGRSLLRLLTQIGASYDIAIVMQRYKGRLGAYMRR